MARKSGLGRGLGALLGETSGEVRMDKATDLPVTELPLSSIEPNPDQPRHVFDEDELNELAESIAQNGILQPLVVRPHDGEYQIVAGERRYQAARRVGLPTVPVVVREVSDDEVLQLALIENLQRTDLNPMEAAQGYRALMDQNGLTQEELGKIVCKSRSAVANALRLLELPPEVRQMVEDGLLSAGHARAILSVRGDEGRVALAQKIEKEGLSVRQTEILGPLFSVKEEGKEHRRTPAPETYKSAARRLRNDLHTKVSVRTVRGRNKIEIEFKDDRELEDLVERILGD